jgi:hypothetical protein
MRGFPGTSWPQASIFFIDEPLRRKDTSRVSVIESVGRVPGSGADPVLREALLHDSVGGFGCGGDPRRDPRWQTGAEQASRVGKRQGRPAWLQRRRVFSGTQLQQVWHLDRIPPAPVVYADPIRTGCGRFGGVQRRHLAFPFRTGYK